ncbi:MAG: hypothetical protein RMN24_00005, partial [Anaerolineae bacterium]|nr:hypothetical protein [Anaerolineae bacterium]
MNTLVASPCPPADDLVWQPAAAVAASLLAAQEAVEVARGCADRIALAAALVALARLRFRLGQYAAAQALADEALATAPDRSPVRADAWQVLANCAAEVETPQA